jgi:hypothetical protein
MLVKEPHFPASPKPCLKAVEGPPLLLLDLGVTTCREIMSSEYVNSPSPLTSSEDRYCRETQNIVALIHDDET